MSEKPVRAAILETAANLTLGDRAKEYGECVANMRNTADMITSYLRARGLLAPGASLTAEDAAMIMVQVKASRIAGTGPYKDDNHIDLAGYAAIAAECADAEQSTARTALLSTSI